MSPTWRRAAKTPRRRPERLPGVTPPPSHTRAVRPRVALQTARMRRPARSSADRAGTAVDSRAGRGLHPAARDHAAAAPDLREHDAPARPPPAPPFPHPVADRRGRRAAAPRSWSPPRRSARSPDSVGLRRLGLRAGRAAARRPGRARRARRAAGRGSRARRRPARGGASGMSGSSGVIGVSSTISPATRSSRGRTPRMQDLGDRDRAVVALAVLEQRDQRPPDRDRGAVQRGHVARAAARAAGSGCRAAGPGSRSCSTSRSARGSAAARAATPRSRTSWPPRSRGRPPRC